MKHFLTGHLVITPLARLTLPMLDVARAIRRHLSNDWGECDPHDSRANDAAIDDGGRIFSVYRSAATGTKFWIITEGDRSSTCILLPEEY